MEVRAIVIKTSGSLIQEFQQMICGLIVSSDLNIPVMFTVSDELRSQCDEYFEHSWQFISISEICACTYFYNPLLQQDKLDLLVKGIEYEYFIFEVDKDFSEFKRRNMNCLQYSRLKSVVHKNIFNSVHEYVFPQIDTFFDTSKINVALIYDDCERKIYELCNVDVYNYIDISNISTIKHDKVNTLYITDVLLLYIIASMCDLLIGSANNLIAYEACFRNMIMLHDVTNTTNTSNIVKPQLVYDENCIFPNSQLLLKYM
jgi:hypothetical protein